MISLRKEMDAFDRQRADALLNGWRTSLIAAATSAGRAVPNVSTHLFERMSAFGARLSMHLPVSEMIEIQTSVRDEFFHWGEDAAKSSEDNLNQVKEVMIAVAASAAAIAQKDQRYTGRLHVLTERLHSVSKLNDVRTMRQALIQGASEMKVCVQQMAEEGERALSQLKAEVEQYRSQVKEFHMRASIDPLTGLANRPAIDARIQDSIAWSACFSVAVLDLNGFKKVNDTYGHAVGDELLKRFAAEIKNLVRTTDLVGRWGGDEFVIVIEAPLEDASAMLDRVCDWAFGEYELAYESQSIKVPVHAAAGIAQWDGSETALDLFNRADHLMYCAKERGSTPKTGIKIA